MKTWFVMRHAKSDWGQPGLDDHDRRLNPRGERDAPKMGRLLRAEGHTPDAILSSTALRAAATARAVHTESGCPGEPSLFDALYLAEPKDYMALLATLDDVVQAALTVAHNPGCETVIELLTGSWAAMPTAAIAHVELDLDSWSELDAHTPATLRTIWRPKELDIG